MDRGISAWDDIARLFDDVPRPIVFDVGANRGQTVERLFESMPRAEVHCFEPVASTFKLLTDHVSRYSSVRTINCGLSGAAGEGWITNVAGSGTNRLVQSPNHSSAEEIVLLTVDEYCNRQGIDTVHVLKSDCEGHDLEVLRGAKAALKSHRVLSVFPEVSFLQDSTLAKFYQIERFLREYSMVFYGLYDYSGWQYDVSRDGFMNALFVHEGVLVSRANRS